MRSILDIAADFLVEDTNPIMESFHDESVDQAKKYIENNYDELYKFKGYKELAPEKPKDLKTFAAQKVRDIQGLIIYPFNYGARNEFKWLNSYVLGLVRIMYKDLNYDKPKFKHGLISDLKKVYFTAVYARQDGIANNDKSLVMDKNMNNLSFSELKTKFMPLFDHYYEIYKKNKEAYIADKKDHSTEELKFVVDTSIKYDGSGKEIKHFDEPYHENSFKIGKYNACVIPNHRAAATWNYLTNKTSSNLGCNWCITIPNDSSHWDGYDCGRTRTVYFCWTDDFMSLNVKDFNDGSAPYNAWGKSLICVMVNRSDDPNKFISQVTSRYNHCDGNGENASSSLGFGDYFCGEPDTEGLADNLAKILGCSVSEIKEKLVYEGIEQDETEARTNRYAHVMEDVEYYTNDCRFDQFDEIRMLPDNYAIVSYISNTSNITLMLKNNKPVPNFIFSHIEPLYIGKSIDDCVFLVFNENARDDDRYMNIVYGANPETYFDHDLAEVIPIYKFNKGFDPENYDIETTKENRLIFCSIRNDYAYTLFDLDKKEFLIDEPCYIKSAFKKDGEIYLSITDSSTSRDFSELSVYNLKTGKRLYVKTEYLPELNGRLNGERIKCNGSYVYNANLSDLLFDMYNMKPIEAGYSYDKESVNIVKDYLVAFDDKGNAVVFYKGDKIDTIDTNSYIACSKYNSNNPNILTVKYNHTDNQNVYYKGKCIFRSLDFHNLEHTEPIILGNVLYAKTEENVKLEYERCSKYILIDINTQKTIADNIYFGRYVLEESVAHNDVVIGMLIDNNELTNYVVIDLNGNIKKLEMDEIYSDTDFAIIKNGGKTLIIKDANIVKNNGDRNLLVTTANFSLSTGIKIYNTDGSIFYQDDNDSNEVKYISMSPLGYGFWMLTREIKINGFKRTIQDIFDKNGKIIIGNGNKEEAPIGISIIKHFSENEDMVISMTKFGKYLDTYDFSISKDGELKRMPYNWRNENYIQNIAAYLL